MHANSSVLSRTNPVSDFHRKLTDSRKVSTLKKMVFRTEDCASR
jgi:hypothetical protein